MFRINKTTFASLALAGAFITVFTACSDDEGSTDLTAPVIEVLDPEWGEAFAAGEHIHFDANLSDNDGLASFQVDIHNNFDGHSHGRSTAHDPSLVKFSYLESFDVPSGAKNYNAHLHDDIEIVENALAGPYHLIVNAIDINGNSTSFQDGSTVEIEILITNNSMAIVEVTNMHHGELELEIDEAFEVNGTISDLVPAAGEYAGIDHVEIMLGEEGEHGGHGHSHGRIADDDHMLIDVEYEHEDLEEFMEDGVINLAMLFNDINFVLTQEMADELEEEDVDHLELTIKVKDNQGNYTIQRIPVHVHFD